ncbi:short-chain dehydrogenase [Crocosphaera sp. UHCC 0190]|uniref:short-chain dehydrogenase n=1 Tax=Crocosphaera sp. UHCC 0190 TaxID=3110246 RepID=UPI002B1F1D55|nr:short-chain dehydrogenase [Crocosphaera sp. UHCC 0190]MEA5508375.1 short-chain dehydrogenase [Crocosphaera sp. UHCC 0190]
MYTNQSPSMFDTLEGYENFVNELLEKETSLTVDPLLDWEDAIRSHNFLLKSVEN